MIRVGIVDDHALVREGLRALLTHADGIAVAFDAADGEQAIALAVRHAPDVLLLDLRMPVLDGLGTLRRLRDEGAAARVLVLTTFDDDEALIEAVALGARGFLLKDAALDDLVAAIQSVAAGETAVRPAATTRVADALRRPARPEARRRAPQLTMREIEVLRLLSAGLSNREIGEALLLAEGTVKNHVSVILSKLGVRDRTRAVLRAVEEGLV
ncbi:MAG TPA: response regulator transcription factor [Phycisphaerales bacterium]|nr:response regulator transcription factor [Phycisphaerales bacterium]HMP37505.1 response regulator transcription factor [Phycisphaerales bacterium]